MERVFPADPVSLREIRAFVRDQARRASLDASSIEELAVAVSEAATNSIRHTESATVRLHVIVDGACLVIEIEDEGTFARPLAPSDVEVSAAGGRGLPLMTAFVDELSIHEGTEEDPGTTVRLVKCRPGR